MIVFFLAGDDKYWIETPWGLFGKRRKRTKGRSGDVFGKGSIGIRNVFWGFVKVGRRHGSYCRLKVNWMEVINFWKTNVMVVGLWW